VQKVYTRTTRSTRLSPFATANWSSSRKLPSGVAAHGYNAYYLNALAGSARSMAAPTIRLRLGPRRLTEQDPRLPMVKR